MTSIAARRLTLIALAALAAVALAGCNTIVLNAPGDVARQQGNLVITATLLMLLIVVPVIIIALVFAWRYRAANKARHAEYDPDWDHSTQLELVIWAAPLLIIIALGAITWITTHTLDPYRPVERTAPGKPIAKGVEPLVIEVVALDWKWLFLYPEQDIATVNEVAIPLDRPVKFKITASSVMNSFYIPALAGQIYAMPGMETQLHAVMGTRGVFDGFSANYSGKGFSAMRFKLHGLDSGGFDQWVAKARKQGDSLGRSEYLQLEKPSSREPVRYYGSVANGLYESILNRCVDTSKMCMNEMMSMDRSGGDGRRGLDALSSIRSGDTREGAFVKSGMCVTPRDATLQPWTDGESRTSRYTPSTFAGLSPP